MCSPLFFTHRDLQHHHHAIKAVKIAHSAQGKRQGNCGFRLITARGRLMVLWAISDELHFEFSLPRRHAIQYLEYMKENYQTSDLMVDHAIQIVLPTPQTAFPGCIAVFAFDNALNHSCFASDALRIGKLDKDPVELNPLCGRVLFTTKACHRQCSFYKTVEFLNWLASLQASLQA